MWGFILYSSFLILHSQLDRGLAHKVADVFHQFLMVMVGAAACTAHHAHRATFPAHPEVEQLLVDEVKQIEAPERIVLKDAAIFCTSLPRGDYMETERHIGLLHTPSQRNPLHGTELDEHRRGVEGFFLFDKLHLLVPQVNVTD